MTRASRWRCALFAGNRNDPTTVPDQIRIVKEQFGVEIRRRPAGRKGKQALGEAGLRYLITALIDRDSAALERTRRARFR